MATVEGRLTLTELTERTEAACTATTRGDLVPITADLPSQPDSPATPMRPVARSDREWVVALMGVSSGTPSRSAGPCAHTLEQLLVPLGGPVVSRNTS